MLLFFFKLIQFYVFLLLTESIQALRTNVVVNITLFACSHIGP